MSGGEDVLLDVRLRSAQSSPAGPGDRGWPGSAPEDAYHRRLAGQTEAYRSAMLGLIYNVKKPKVTVHFAAKQLVPSQSLLQTHREWHMSEPEETQELLAA